MAKLKSTDKFLVQRGEAKLVAFASDLELYQESSVGEAIDKVDQKLDVEIAARKVGDQQLDDRIDSLSARIRVGVDGLFPSKWEHRYEFNLQMSANYNFLNAYTECISDGTNGFDEDDCYLRHVLDFYTTYSNLSSAGNYHGLFTGQFGNAANTVASNLKTLIVDDRYGNTNDTVLDWNSVKEGDFISITPLNAFTNDLDNFGLYEVKKNLVTYFIENGDITDKIKEQNCYELEYLGGNDELSIRQGFEYDIRVMNDLATNLSGDFVSKSGDTMSGSLTIVNTESLNCVTVDSGQDTNLTLKRYGQRKLLIGGNETIHDQKSVYTTGASATISDPLDIVHKQYVDDVVVIAGQELDDLSDQVDILNNRIEAVAKILEQYELVCVSGDGCDGLAEPDYSACAEPKMVNNGDLRFQFVGDDTNASVVGIQSNQTILFSKRDKNGGLIQLTGFAVGDTLEFFAESGSASNVIYKVITLDSTNADYYKVGAEYQYGSKSNEAQNGETYRLKFYRQFEGIGASEAASLFVNKTGDDMTGPLTISKSGSFNDVLLTLTDSNNSSVDIKSGNGIEITTLDETASVAVSTKINPNFKTTKLLDDGLRADASNNAAMNLRVASDIPTVVISSSAISLEDNPIRNVLTEASDTTSAANVDYVNKAIEGISVSDGITSSISNGVRTFGLDIEYFNIENLRDLKGSTPSDGDTLVYSTSLGKWQFTSGSQVNKGKSLVSDSEESTDVGGLWSDGKNYYIKTA